MMTPERKSILWRCLIFSFLVLGLAFIGPLLGGSPSSPGLGFFIWGTAPLLAAFLLRLITRNWADAGLKPAFSKNGWWYSLSILAYPVMTVLTLLLGILFSFSSSSGFAIAPYLKTFLSALPLFFIFALCEEMGWRGYLVPKLASAGINSYLAAVVIGVVWATWHLPYIRELTWVYSSEALAAFIPRFYLSMIANALLYNEIRLITGSIWPAVLMHGVMNSFGHPLTADYITIVSGKEYLVSGTGLLMIAFTGLLGTALNRWRMRKGRPLKSFSYSVY